MNEELSCYFVNEDLILDDVCIRPTRINKIVIWMSHCALQTFDFEIASQTQRMTVLELMSVKKCDPQRNIVCLAIFDFNSPFELQK